MKKLIFILFLFFIPYLIRDLVAQDTVQINKYKKLKDNLLSLQKQSWLEWLDSPQGQNWMKAQGGIELLEFLIREEELKGQKQ